jgi:hypothetical protein
LDHRTEDVLDKVFISAKDAAIQLGLSPITLAIWRCRRPRVLPYYKQRNGRIMYDLEDVATLATQRAAVKKMGGSSDGPTCGRP